MRGGPGTRAADFDHHSHQLDKQGMLEHDADMGGC